MLPIRLSSWTHPQPLLAPRGIVPGCCNLRYLARKLHGLFHDQVGLAALATRQAGGNLVWMITLGVMVGVLLLSA